MENQRYGALIVVKDSGQRTSNRIKIWECLCDCGETYLVRQDSLKSGATTCCKKCRYSKNIMAKYKYFFMVNIKKTL